MQSADLPQSFGQWVLRCTVDDGQLEPYHFQHLRLSMPTLQDGQALVRVRLINIHSATRLRIARRSIAIGETDPNNYALGEVVLSRDPAFAVGAVVACQAGWQEYQVISSRDLPVGFSEPSAVVKALNRTNSPWTYAFRSSIASMWPPHTLMEVLGTSGMTAWFGMREYGPLMPRDAVAVAATTGSVGSIVAQLAKAAGCRVVGFAGGPERCEWVLDTLRIDGCLDYKSTSLVTDIRAAFPEGIDVFSDGVGGSLTELVTRCMNRHGRIFSYGSAAAAYASRLDAPSSKKPSMRVAFGLTEAVDTLLQKRNIKSGAWTVDKFYHERLTAEDDLSRLMLMGMLHPNGNVIRGFEHLPKAIVDLYRFPRAGKLQVAFE